MFLRVQIIAFLVLFALSACEDPKDQLRSHMARAIEFFETGDYRSATLELKNALQIDATHGEAYYYLGRIYDLDKSWSQAFRAFGQAVDQSPDHVDANIRLGRYLLMTGHYARAMARAEHAINISEGKNASAFALRAALAIAQGEFEKAEQDAKNALAVDPTSEDALAALSGVFTAKGQPEGALPILADAIRSHPRNTSFRIAKIELHARLGQQDEALSESIGLIETEPESLDHRVGLARLYTKWGRLDEAEVTLRSAIERIPDNTDAKLSLIDFLSSRRDEELAESQLRTFIANEPENLELRLALTDFLYKSGHVQEAIDDLEGVLVSTSADINDVLHAKTILATLYVRKENYGNAKLIIDEVLEAEAKNPEALIIRAQLQSRDGAKRDAIATLRLVLRDNPGSPVALQNLAAVYLETGQIEATIDTLHQLIDFVPDDPAVRVQLAQLIAEKGQMQAALSHLTHALEKSPGYVPALSSKADLLLAMGSIDAARAITEQIKSAKQTATALKLEGRVERASGNPESALSAFEQAYDLDRTDQSTIDGIILSFASLQQLDQAEEFLQSVAAEQTENIKVWIRLGDVYRVQRKRASAIKSYKHALTIDPTSVIANNRLVNYYIGLREPTHAIGILRAAIDADPNNNNFRLALALILTLHEQYEQAIALYEEIIARGERSRVVINNLAALVSDFSYDEQGRVERTLELVKKLHTSNDPRVLDTIGWLNYRAGRTADAISFMKRALALGGDISAVNYHLGEIYYASDDKDVARKYLTAALSKKEALPRRYVERAEALVESLSTLGENKAE